MTRQPSLPFWHFSPLMTLPAAPDCPRRWLCWNPESLSRPLTDFRLLRPHTVHSAPEQSHCVSWPSAVFPKPSPSHPAHRQISYHWLHGALEEVYRCCKFSISFPLSSQRCHRFPAGLPEDIHIFPEAKGPQHWLQ